MLGRRSIRLFLPNFRRQSNNFRFERYLGIMRAYSPNAKEVCGKAKHITAAPSHS